MEIVASSVESNGVPVTVFTITGDIDNRTHQQLESDARAAFDGGARRLLFDLTGVRYVGSQGLRAIHTIFTIFRDDQETDLQRQAGMRAGTYTCATFKLCGVQPPIREVLHVAGYDMFLDILPSRQAALAAFTA